MRVGAGNPGVGARTTRVVTAARIAKSVETEGAPVGEKACSQSVMIVAVGAIELTNRGLGSHPIMRSGLCGKQLRRGCRMSVISRKSGGV